MRFVEDHLTHHHLFHAPHRWFFALLLSPIHLAELHYKHRYHLQYGNAKKLFVFDMVLLLSALFLCVATIFWFTYNPAVLGMIDLAITPIAHDNEPIESRMKSGDHVAYQISFKNGSKKQLSDAHMTVDLPVGFILLETEPKNIFTADTHTFALGTIPPGGSGHATINGLLYGTPDQEQSIVAHLSYLQEGQATRETKTGRIFITLRGSVIETSLEAPATVFTTGNFPISFVVKNSNHHALPPLSIALPTGTGMTLKEIQINAGKLDGNKWLLPTLAGDAAATGTANIALSLPKNSLSTILQLVPHVTVGGALFTQVPTVLPVHLTSPDVTMSAIWTDGSGQLQPGDRPVLHLTVQNTSKNTLHEGSVTIPIRADIFDLARVTGVKTGMLVVNALQNSDLKNIPPGDSVTIDIPLSLNTFIASAQKDLVLSLTPVFTAHIDGVTFPFTEIVATPARNIGTSLRISDEARYYTNEGDQLGRGPLPPVVGKETKYWATVRVENTTSDITQLAVSAVLPQGITWTGKKSLTHGKDISYEAATRTVRWRVPVLYAHEEASVSIELSIKPTDDQRGTTPPLLTQVRLTATDAFIDKPLATTAPDLDMALRDDIIAQEKGVAVQ